MNGTQKHVQVNLALFLAAKIHPCTVIRLICNSILDSYFCTDEESQRSKRKKRCTGAGKKKLFGDTEGEKKATQEVKQTNF